MVHFKHVQIKAQREIDQVIGRDRLPSLEDRKSSSLPYLEATVKELLRWMPAGPLSKLQACPFNNDGSYRFVY